MPTDESLIHHILRVLERLSGGSLPQDTLGAEVEIAAHRPLTTAAINDALTFARDQGWVSCRRDPFGRQSWSVTEAGKNELLPF